MNDQGKLRGMVKTAQLQALTLTNVAERINQLAKSYKAQADEAMGTDKELGLLARALALQQARNIALRYANELLDGAKQLAESEPHHE